MRTASAPSPSPTLRRLLGKWDLTALGVNQVIGGAIFLMPSQVAAQIGNWSPIAFLLAGLASLFVALCFAEAGSRFEGTGGPYLYTQAAFGRFVAFETGWMQWFTRVSSHASIVNGLALAIAFYFPAIGRGMGRAVMIIVITLGLGWINARGIRQSSFVVNLLTVAKLVPLAVFIGIGLFFVDWHRLVPLPDLTAGQAATAGLLLIFAYGGFDVLSVPAGEATAPRRDVPFAFITTIAAVTLIMTLCQIIAMTVLPDVTRSTTPVADAAMAFLGPVGAAFIGIGSVISISGNNAGAVLAGSRMLFALAENDALPRFFGRIHPVYRTPANAIWFSVSVTLVLALTGSFAVLAAASAVARLVTYSGVAAAVIALRRPACQERVQPATFTIPFGAIIPVLAILVSLAILAGASWAQLRAGGIALGAGAVLFGIHRGWYSGSMRNILRIALVLTLPALLLHAEKKVLNPPELGTPSPNFSAGILTDGTLYAAGQIGTDLKTNQIPDSFEDEVKACLERVGIILKAGGMSFEDAVSVQVYLTDVGLFARMNAVYTTYFKQPRPARTTVGVTKLANERARIEITVTARK